MDAETDTTGGLGDHRAVLESVVDALDGVVFHGEEEARAQLRVRSAGIEEGRGGVCKVALGHEVVGLEYSIDIVTVNANGNTHNHLLGSLCWAAIDAEEIGTLKSLETEVVVVKVAIVDDGGVEHFGVVLDDLVGLVGDHGCRPSVLGIY